MLSNTHTHNSKSEYLAIIDGPLQTFFFSKRETNFVREYINRVVYSVYIILAEKDKNNGKDIDDLFYILS